MEEEDQLRSMKLQKLCEDIREGFGKWTFYGVRPGRNQAGCAGAEIEEWQEISVNQ